MHITKWRLFTTLISGRKTVPLRPSRILSGGRLLWRWRTPRGGRRAPNAHHLAKATIPVFNTRPLLDIYMRLELSIDRIDQGLHRSAMVRINSQNRPPCRSIRPARAEPRHEWMRRAYGAEECGLGITQTLTRKRSIKAAKRFRPAVLQQNNSALSF